jgi:hypothetical protein
MGATVAPPTASVSTRPRPQARNAPRAQRGPAVAVASGALGAEQPEPQRLALHHLGVEVIVTMGCGESCLISLGARYLDWELEDHPER